MTNPHVAVAPRSNTQNGNTYRGTVNQLPINAGDPVWVGQDGADTDTECFMTDDLIAQVGDRVLYIKEGRYGIIVGKIAPQPGWQALSPFYASGITDFGTPFDIGAYIKLGTIVYLRGTIKTTTTFALGTTLITMPTGCGMNNFDASGSIFHGGVYSTTSPFAMRLVIQQYAIKIQTPALPSAANIGLTGLCYPADI